MDRISICEGYYLFSTHWHASGRTERCHQQGRTIDVQLHGMRFRPSPLLSLENASEEATEVYMGLVDRYHGAEQHA